MRRMHSVCKSWFPFERRLQTSRPVSCSINVKQRPSVIIIAGCWEPKGWKHGGLAYLKARRLRLICINCKRGVFHLRQINRRRCGIPFIITAQTISRFLKQAFICFIRRHHYRLSSRPASINLFLMSNDNVIIIFANYIIQSYTKVRNLVQRISVFKKDAANVNVTLCGRVPDCSWETPPAADDSRSGLGGWTRSDDGDGSKFCEYPNEKLIILFKNRQQRLQPCISA